MKTITERAHLLIALDKVRRDENDEDFWLVDSLSCTGVIYEVYFKGTGGRCTCKGYKYRKTCIHLEAVRILANRNRTPVMPDGEVLV